MIKKVLIYSIAVFFFLPCQAQQFGQETIQGTFYRRTKDRDFSSTYTLELHHDGSFLLTEKSFEGNPQCKGKWEVKDDKFIVLKCSDVNDPEEILTNGYMSKRTQTLLIISRNRLRYNDVILKRKR